MLLGDRKEFRFGEVIGKFFMILFSVFIPKRYKAVEAEDVAAAMIKAANDEKILGGIMENELIRNLV